MNQDSHLFRDIQPFADRLGRDVHFFRIFEENILMDVESGSIHLVDDVVVKVLAAGSLTLSELEKILPEVDSQEIAAVLSNLTDLYHQGTLFSSQEVPPALCGDQDEVKALCLNVAHACNMRCRYCFACDGTYGQASSIMPAEVACAAIDFLFLASKGRRHLEVDFFGGEPLLAMDTVKKAVKYGKLKAQEQGRTLKFTLTTNALALDDEIADYLNEEDISAVLSLDGRPETNDHMRRTAGGEGTYQMIAPRIAAFVRKRAGREYYVRGTYTRENLDFSADVQHLAELGFQDVSVEPAVDFYGKDWGIRSEDLVQLKGEYRKLANYCLARMRRGNPLNFFHFNIELTDGPCAAKRASGCGAGAQYLAVDPDGRLWPCHQFVGQDEFALGDVYKGIQFPAVRERFRQASLLKKEACQNCWAKYHCGGGCHANAWGANHNLMQPHEVGCELMRIRLECALALRVKALLLDNEAD